MCRYNVASYFIKWLTIMKKFSGLIQDAATVQVIINEKLFRAIKISEGSV